MERDQLTDQLARHGEIFRAMFNGFTSEEVLWKPAPGKWCALEVLCHLHDEEREDFCARLNHVLETPKETMPPIDPAAWIAERNYIEQDFGSMLEKFLEERSRSILWLRGLTETPWGNAYLHPKVGPVSCDLLLANWVAHDLHHIRQLVNLRYSYLSQHSNVPLDYAGTW